MAPGNLPQSTFQSKNRISSASPVPQAAPKTHSSAFFYPFPQNRRKSASLPHFKTILSEGTDTAFFRAVMHNFAPVQKTFSGLCPPLSDLFPYNRSLPIGFAAHAWPHSVTKGGNLSFSLPRPCISALLTGKPGRMLFSDRRRRAQRKSLSVIFPMAETLLLHPAVPSLFKGSCRSR